MPDSPHNPDEPGHRELGEQLFAERHATSRPELAVLEAIYHELRHGHDQVGRQIEALAKHAIALDEHADAMDGLKKGMYYEGDMHSRRR